MLYIFDKDGTICRSTKGNFVNSVDEQELYPDVLPRLAKLKHDDIIAVVSNQGGVAFGFMDQATAGDIVRHAAQMIGARDYVFCPHHPEGTNEFGIKCEYRKPKPGMIFFLLERFNCLPEDACYIGDMRSDLLASRKAGIVFHWSDDFFGRGTAQER